MYIYIYIYIHIHVYAIVSGCVGLNPLQSSQLEPVSHSRSISEISSCSFGPRPWHIEIRHRVKRTSTTNLFGFETLKLKFRRLKLWKPTASASPAFLSCL